MRIYALTLCWFLTSCGLEPKEYLAPDGLIPQDSMVLIMHDLSILESSIHQKHVQLERYALLLRISGDSLLNDFGISRERYELSMDYYGKKPELFLQIYDSLLFKLEGGKVTQKNFEGLETHGF